jgi:type III restriction enzyme
MAQYHTRPARLLSPAERGEPFLVPQLTLLQDGEPEFAEYVVDDHIWNILDYPAELTEADFKIEEKASTYEFDIKGEKLTYKFLGKQLPLDFSDTESGLTDLQLTRWLEPRLRQPNIRPENLLEFIRKTIKQLLERRNIPLVTLVRARFQLLKAMAAKIKEYQLMDSKSNYRALLFGDNTVPETTYDYAFTFDPNSYPANDFYHGRYQFSKHYYGNVMGAFDTDEELECAKAIDQSSAVKYWVRNLVHDTWAFRLPLSNGKFFYPNFVAMLNDARILAGVVAGKNGLGLVLAVSVLVANLPQLWLASKESNLTDLSLGTWSISTIEGLIWLSYAFLRQDAAIIVSAFFQAMTSGLIVAFKLARQAKIERQEES